MRRHLILVVRQILMKPISPDTIMRFKRAAIFSVCALIVFILRAKIGFIGRTTGYVSPASWSDIANHLDTYILISFAVGGLAYFWPSNWKV